MLEVKNLAVNYGSVKAVRGVDLSAEPGRITLVLGANGAGKTSILRSIAGLHRASAGEVTLDGRSIVRDSAYRIVRSGLVLVPEGRKIFGSLTVEENLRLGGYTAKRSQAPKQLESIYDIFPILADRRNGKAGLLSGGEQQMLAFGRGLMSSPRVMLMDEPSMGLAPAIVDTVLSATRAIADQGVAVLMVEQNAEAGLEVADTAVVVSLGAVAFSGSAEVARSHASVVEAFLGESAIAAAVEQPRDAGREGVGS